MAVIRRPPSTGTLRRIPFFDFLIEVFLVIALETMRHAPHNRPV